jgi:hypothetical protein
MPGTDKTVSLILIFDDAGNLVERIDKADAEKPRLMPKK